MKHSKNFNLHVCFKLLYFVIADPLAIHLNKKQGEFIFLLDRSGSMYGKKIQMAKQALMFLYLFY